MTTCPYVKRSLDEGGTSYCTLNGPPAGDMADLKERLERAVLALEGNAERVDSQPWRYTGTRIESARLHGKIEGVKVALDMMRAYSPPPDVSGQ
jgi:hypothetical protein